MEYLWTEDKGAGFHFWKLVNQHLFNGRLVVKSKGSNQALLDITCFEHIILSFTHLIQWTGTGRKDKIEMRTHILNALKNHRIDIDSINDEKTLNYLMGFKRYSTERVIKSLTNELTDGDDWSVKGESMGKCWHESCCILEKPEKARCNLKSKSGDEKIMTLLQDAEIQRIIKNI